MLASSLSCYSYSKFSSYPWFEWYYNELNDLSENKVYVQKKNSNESNEGN